MSVWMRGAALALTLLVWSAARAPAAEALHVSVAVSLKPAFEEIARSFEGRWPGVEVRLNAGASGVLLQQTRHGAPTDLFVSASPAEIDRLESEGRVAAGSRRSVAANRLVVIVPAGRTPPETLGELARPVYDRLAAGNPRTAPVGRYADEALRSLGLWETLGPRLIYAENARQVLDYVSRGEVAAGLVYESDAMLLPERVTRGPLVPSGSHAPILYQAVVLGDAHRPEEARALLGFLLSEAGRDILKRHGFAAPPPGS